MIPHLQAEIVSVSVLVILSAGLVLTLGMFKVLRAMGVPDGVMDNLDQMHHITTLLIFAFFFISMVRHAVVMMLHGSKE